MRKKDKGKILAVLLAVMLIVSCMPAGIAFAAVAPANPSISPASGSITTSTPVGIANIAAGDTAYFTINGSDPTVHGTVYSAPFTLSVSGTVYAAVYDSSTRLWSGVVSATFTVTGGGGGGGGGSGTVVNTPTVQTEAATVVTATSSALNGDITSNNGYAVTDYGFLWGTSSSSLTNTLDVGTDNHSGAFTDTLSSLTTGTTYYFEAYATNSYGTADGAVMSFTAGVATPTTPAAPTTPVFSDVSASYWGYSAISSLASKGIIVGYPDGTFKPDASITRAEFATMLVKALALNTSGTTGTFTDVTAGAWYYGTVNAAASAGIVYGIGDHLFAPNALVTREQMAVMVAKALGNKAPATNGTELNAFSDKSAVSSWAVSGMDEAVKAGIVSGMTADTLAPMANATRAQAAEMIYKMLAV